MKKWFFVLFLWPLLSKGQNYHFSQFYAAPLWNNPALTGYIEGPYRIAANFRSQWVGGSMPYLTGALSGDVSLLSGRLAEGNTLGMGIAFLNDQSLNGALQTNSVALSTAYNLVLDPDGVHSIGAGLQGVYHHRKIDFTKLTFENQWAPGGFNSAVPVAELLSSPSQGYVDLNAGLLYNQLQEDHRFFIGLSGNNLLQRKTNLSSEVFQIPVRYTALAGAQTDVGYAGVLYLSLNHQRQASAHETTFGTAYGLKIGEATAQEVNLGLWYRWGDALIPYLGYRLEGLQAGISYDYTVSGIKSGGMIRNSFELSVVYTAKDNREMKRLVPWY